MVEIRIFMNFLSECPLQHDRANWKIGFNPGLCTRRFGCSTYSFGVCSVSILSKESRF